MVCQGLRWNPSLHIIALLGEDMISSVAPCLRSVSFPTSIISSTTVSNQTNRYKGEDRHVSRNGNHRCVVSILRESDALHMVEYP